MIDLYELFMSFYVSRITFRMILKSQLSICILYLIERSISREFKSSIVGVEWILKMLVKKLLLLLIRETMFIEESLKSLMSIFNAVFTIQ